MERCKTIRMVLKHLVRREVHANSVSHYKRMRCRAIGNAASSFWIILNYGKLCRRCVKNSQKPMIEELLWFKAFEHILFYNCLEAMRAKKQKYKIYQIYCIAYTSLSILTKSGSLSWQFYRSRIMETMKWDGLVWNALCTIHTTNTNATKKKWTKFWLWSNENHCLEIRMLELNHFLGSLHHT